MSGPVFSLNKEIDSGVRALQSKEPLELWEVVCFWARKPNIGGRYHPRPSNPIPIGACVLLATLAFLPS